MHNLALAEDVTQEALLRALETWKLRGAPDNPGAWLMAAARNRALDVLRRERTAREFAPDVGRLLESEWTVKPTLDELLQPQAIADDQLRMMFSCCHPRLSLEASVSLILQILCGFSVAAVAAAFLEKPAAVEKRLARAKKTLAGSRRLFDLTDGDLPERLAAVERALYLLFNQGYHGASPETPIQADLCREAIHLATLLCADARTARPTTHALTALMCFHAARLPGRVDAAGNLATLFDQDRSKWDRALIETGKRALERSAEGEVSEFHLEAAIAAMHAVAPTAAETDWAMIVSLYDRLLERKPSPVVALNRAIALAQLEGPAKGLEALLSIPGVDRLAAYPFYPAAVAELELKVGHPTEARASFRRAISLARNPSERAFFEARLKACG